MFTFLAIVIASLGLFALSAFTVEQRTKEVSIRVVLGATAIQIIRMFTGSFVKLVVLSILIGAPLAWYMMDRWLTDYAYRISLGWEIFLAAALLAFTIALLTVGLQAAKLAFGNPARNLRAE